MSNKHRQKGFKYSDGDVVRGVRNRNEVAVAVGDPFVSAVNSNVMYVCRVYSVSKAAELDESSKDYSVAVLREDQIDQIKSNDKEMTK